MGTVLTNTGSFEDILLAERKRLLATVNRTTSPFSDEDVLGLEDQPRLLHDQFLALAVNEMGVLKLRQIEAALQRLRSGTYGICEECGRRISDKRLHAIPWTEVCVTCAERLAAAERIPHASQRP
jgi:DnaK suppressor protein